MSDTIPRDLVISNLRDVLDEAFEHHHGIFLDQGTALFESIEALDATAASRSVSSSSASIAAHVDHLRFYLDVLERHMRGEEVGSLAVVPVGSGPRFRQQAREIGRLGFEVIPHLC